MKIVERPTRRLLPTRPGAPVGVVVHGTGEPNLTKALAFYTSDSGLCSHYVIGYDGTIYRIADESLVAWHCKMEAAEARLYQQGYPAWSEWIWNDGSPKHLGQEFTGYRPWRETWLSRGISSPLDLITRERPNHRSIGIELLSPDETIRTPGIYTDSQYLALAELLKDISKRNGIRIERSRIMGHYDVTPMRRCTNRGGYDPGDGFDWNRLWDLTK